MAVRPQAGVWRGSKSSIRQILFSPDGRTLFEYAIEGDPQQPDQPFGRIWDLRTKRPISPLSPRMAYATYTPAGDRVLTSAGAPSWSARPPPAGRGVRGLR